VGSKSNPLIGMIVIGFGILMLWSAYTKKPLFGAGGLIRSFISTGSFDSAGGTLGRIAGNAAQQIPINKAVPPGAGSSPPGETPIWT
jgi:hypothetical protein